MKIGIFPPGHPRTQSLEKFCQARGLLLSLSEDLNAEDLEAIFVHPDHSVPFALEFLPSHLVLGLSQFDLVRPNNKVARSLIYEHFGELLQTQKIQPQIQHPAIITYSPLARFYVHLLFKVGFQNFTLLHESSDDVTPLCADLSRELLGIHFENCLYQNLTVNPLVGSVLVNCRSFEESDESYKTLCYLNFLSRGAFVISLQATRENILSTTAAESSLHLIGLETIRAFAFFRFLTEIKMFPPNLSRGDFIRDWEAGL